MEPYDESIHGPLQRPALKRQSTHSQHQPRNLQSKHQPHQRSSDLHQPHHKKQMQESSDLHQSHPKQQMQTAASGPTATRLANPSNTSEACNAAMPSHHSDSAPTQVSSARQVIFAHSSSIEEAGNAAMPSHHSDSAPTHASVARQGPERHCSLKKSTANVTQRSECSGQSAVLSSNLHCPYNREILMVSALMSRCQYAGQCFCSASTRSHAA